MSGLAGNTSLRLVPTPEPDDDDMPANITVDVDDDGEDTPELDQRGNVIRIDHGDGTITISLDGKPLEDAEPDKPLKWFDNLVEQVDRDVLSGLTEDLLRGVQSDLDSRRDWIEDRALGLKLLGLKIELPNAAGGTDGAPVEGMSKVRHPLLLEAVLRFQANARSELLPTDGPVKIRNDSTSPVLAMDQAANALEQDMNHYLTAVATEYYPDTDRMLFMTGFGGTGFKKVYFCPLRNRPVSESVDADDLIVNQSATDLANAQRVTHRSKMRPSTLKRMQILGVYRDITLNDAIFQEFDALQEEEAAVQGITVDLMARPEDREREIYEIYCELDIKGFEHEHKKKPSGLAVPYVVTIDKSSREALSIVRNYGEDDDPLPIAKKRFVKFPFVPGLGFLDIGLLHILGNSTNAITAAWRELLDAGMYANFPGFLMADGGGRQNTTTFRIPPGGAASIKTNGGNIRDNVMALPYTTQGMAALMQLVDNMAETGRRIGGTAEVQVGEGRADVPVGTVMAMIDQAIKVMNAVHKRMHSAQAEEFQLLKELFREHPESFCQRKCKSKTVWDKQMFLAALDNCDLVPQADPNTSSSGQRIMKVMGLQQLAKDNATLFDPIKVTIAAMQALGWSNPQEFFVPPDAQKQPPPQLIQAQAQLANEQKAADAKTTEAQARATEAQAKAREIELKNQQGAYAPKQPAGGGEQQQTDTPVDQTLANAKMLDSKTKHAKLQLDAHQIEVENSNRDADRLAGTQDAAVGLAKEVLKPDAQLNGAGERTASIIRDIDRGLGGTQP